MTVEEKRRELFEAWIGSVGILGDNKITIAEKAFNAALDAIEIELPAEAESPLDSYAYGINDSRHDCIVAIESLNLGIKIK